MLAREPRWGTLLQTVACHPFMVDGELKWAKDRMIILIFHYSIQNRLPNIVPKMSLSGEMDKVEEGFSKMELIFFRPSGIFGFFGGLGHSLCPPWPLAGPPPPRVSPPPSSPWSDKRV